MTTDRLDSRPPARSTRTRTPGALPKGGKPAARIPEIAPNPEKSLAQVALLDRDLARAVGTAAVPAERPPAPEVARADHPVYVTRPFLPPLEEFEPLLREIWRTRILTNGGPYHRELERRLCDHLGVPEIALFSNATTALIVALRALGLSGEVITTPYSFVATSHALLWGGLTPVFVDIDPASLNLDPAAIEAAITPRTSAILAVHCYGHPCDVEAIEAIARRHGLKVIYDAAHAFGVRHRGRSILAHGDLSILSFHATKVFNTFEGGAIVCAEAGQKDHLEKLKNFGFENETSVIEVGLNGKMSELNAALGLVQLRHVDAVTARRGAVDALYREGLRPVRGIRCLEPAPAETTNFAYFPILVEPDYPLTRDALDAALKAEGIVPRRYFYPLISDFPMYRDLPSARRDHLPVATAAAERVLCLPIFPDLDESVVRAIVRRIAKG